MLPFELKAHYNAEDLVRVVEILRDPVDGCPWDKVQTHQSIRKNLLEEAYEVAEALDANDPHMMVEELGDLMMQVALHSQMEAEAGHFNFEDVCDAVCQKLIFRHPHIFGPDADHTNPVDWEDIKEQEKGRHTLADELDSVPITLPALMKAQKMLNRAARYGVKQPPLEANLGQDKEQAIGRLLLAAVALARENGVDAEEALTRAARDFARDAKQNSEHKAEHSC